MTLPEFIARDQRGYLHLAGHRIGLHHIISLYNEGYSPEMLLGEFPTLSLALIHKSLGFYLDNVAELDAYAAAEHQAIEDQRSAAPRGPSLQELRRRLNQVTAK